MYLYASNKIISLATIAIFILSTFLIFGYTAEQWKVILLATIVLGYSHYILGAYSQLRSFSRKPNAWQYYLTFVLITIFTIGWSYIFFEYLGFVAVLLVGAAYFVFHGLINEKTLILRQTGKSIPLSFLTPVAVLVMTLLLYSVPHQTFFFDQYLNFHVVNDFWVKYIFDTYYVKVIYFDYLFWTGSALSVALLLYAWMKHRLNPLALFLASVLGVLIVLTAIFGALPYIYMYLVVLGYHFITWGLFFYTELKSRGLEVFKRYIFENLVLFTVLLVCVYLYLNQPPTTLLVWVFDFKIFLIMAHIHISTSFMNEAWLQKLQHSFFKRLTGG